MKQKEDGLFGSLVNHPRAMRWLVFMGLFVSSVVASAHYQHMGSPDHHKTSHQLRPQLNPSLTGNDAQLASNIIHRFSEENQINSIHSYGKDGALFAWYQNNNSDAFNLSFVDAGGEVSITEQNGIIRPIKTVGIPSGALDATWKANESISINFYIVALFVFMGILMATHDLLRRKMNIGADADFNENKESNEKNSMNVVATTMRDMGINICYQNIIATNQEGCSVQSYAYIHWKRSDGAELNFSLAEIAGLTERNSLAIPILPWIMQTIVIQLKSWKVVDPGRKVAFNVSLKQFLSEEYIQFLSQQCVMLNIKTEAISIEVDERLLSKLEQQDVDAAWKRWSDGGISIILSGFGTTSKSREIIGLYPIKKIKWNIAWLRQQFDSTAAKNRVFELKKIIDGLGVQSIVSDIETDEDWRVYNEIQCDHVQEKKQSKITASVNFGKNWVTSTFERKSLTSAIQ